MDERQSARMSEINNVG